jgi:hypothetical protein
MKHGAATGGFALLAIAAIPAGAIGQASSVPPVAPLWQQLILAATGPAVAAVLGGICAELIVLGVQNRRQAAHDAEQERRRQDERAAADRLRDHELKMRLIEEMTIAADSLYFVLQNYWRRVEREAQALAAEPKAELRNDLDSRYQAAGITAAHLETRLRLLFESDKPWKFCHAAHDILTVRYFQLIGLATERLIANNACDDEPGVWHSGLTKEQLKRFDARALFDVYRERLGSAVRAVMKEPIVRVS